MKLLEERKYDLALPHLRQAAALRRRLPWRKNPEFAWMLAAACLNLSDALRGLGDAEALGEAMQALDRGIEAMQYVPVRQRPGFLERLILAWIQRGSLWEELGDREAAAADFTRAERRLSALARTSPSGPGPLHAMLHANRAKWWLAQQRPIEGWEEARKAVSIFRQEERSGHLAEAGIRARAIQCRALALLLEEPGGLSVVEDWIAEATDSVEEALLLVKQTGQREEWVANLVRYGAQIYRVCQPQFLGEFVSDWLAADSPLSAHAPLRRDMLRELLLAQREVERNVLRFAHETEFVARQLQVLRRLQLAQSFLACVPPGTVTELPPHAPSA